ncbi:MAG: hypothetical protein ACD_17C00108G0001, partial [uncultured bacterium]
MKLKKLLKGLKVQVKGNQDVEISGISIDSRQVAFGHLFIAKKGKVFDGAQFVPQAIDAGAVAVLTDIYDPFLKKTQVIYHNVHELEAILAARFYSYPSEELFVAGVTGTKGKTTSAYLIKHLLEPAGLMSTVETVVGEMRMYASYTTHDAIYNQRWLKEMVETGCKAAVLEVSSHGLAQGRVDEIAFDLAVFTNLYPDHLDYHKTVECYAEEKKKLFQRARSSILNADSPWSACMGKGLTYGIEQGEVRAEKIRLSPEGTSFTVDGCEFYIPLIGKFNVYNTLAAIAAALSVGKPLFEMAQKLRSFQPPPARLERVGNVYIDFAHTGEALENVLQTLQEISTGRVIVVFGCGGNRDPLRRTSMAKAADTYADISIITNDNPRQEDPKKIAEEIVMGFRQTTPLVELDREKAIQKALEIASGSDVILIAGKGHEREQILGSRTIPFDDRKVVEAILIPFARNKFIN